MITESTRQFDLYDFFSVLIPGAACLIGIFPFLPEDAPIFSTASIGFLIIGGFVVGRAIHAISLVIEDKLNLVSHREYFAKQIVSPDSVSKPLVSEFYSACKDTFPELDLPENIEELQNSSSEAESDSNDEDDTESSTPDKSDSSIFSNIINIIFGGLFAIVGIVVIALLPYVVKDKYVVQSINVDTYDDRINALYTNIRTYIHMDARGRSRTFQAVYDFYRSMWYVSIIFFFIYLITGIVLILDIEPLPEGYVTFLGSTGISGEFVFLLALVIFAGGYHTFKKVRSKYRTIYIEYLMSDFLVLYRENNNDS